MPCQAEARESEELAAAVITAMAKRLPSSFAQLVPAGALQPADVRPFLARLMVPLMFASYLLSTAYDTKAKEDGMTSQTENKVVQVVQKPLGLRQTHF